jgi:hypothetical protein
MRLIVQPIQIRLRRLFFPSEYDLWAQFDMGNGELAVRVLFQAPDGVIFIIIDDKTFIGRHGEKSQHMATRQSRNKGRLWIDALRIAEICRRCGGRHFDTVFEPPEVITAVSLVAEFNPVSRPYDSCFVFRHGTPSYSGDETRLEENATRSSGVVNE